MKVDLEMSFVDSNGVMGLIEELLSSTLSRTVPHLDVTPPPFPRIPFQQAMDEVIIQGLPPESASHYGVFPRQW